MSEAISSLSLPRDCPIIPASESFAYTQEVAVRSGKARQHFRFSIPWFIGDAFRLLLTTTLMSVLTVSLVLFIMTTDQSRSLTFQKPPDCQSPLVLVRQVERGGLPDAVIKMSAFFRHSLLDEESKLYRRYECMSKMMAARAEFFRLRGRTALLNLRQFNELSKAQQDSLVQQLSREYSSFNGERLKFTFNFSYLLLLTAAIPGAWYAWKGHCRSTAEKLYATLLNQLHQNRLLYLATGADVQITGAELLRRRACQVRKHLMMLVDEGEDAYLDRSGVFRLAAQ